MSGDPRFDVRPSYAPGTTLRVASLLPPLRRPRQATTALHAAIIPPPLRRETAQPAPAWRAGDVVLPAAIDASLDSALPHEAACEPYGSGLPHDDGEEGGL